MGKDRAKFPGRYFGGIAKPISLTCFLRDSSAHSCPSKSVGLPVAMGVSTFSLLEEGETSRLTTNSISIRLLEAVLGFIHRLGRSSSLSVYILFVSTLHQLQSFFIISTGHLSSCLPSLMCCQPDHSFYSSLLRTHHTF